MKRLVIKVSFLIFLIFPAAYFQKVFSQTTQPTLFAPGVVSTEFQESNSSFTPDGKTIYFTRSDFQFRDNTILESHLENGKWSIPRVAPFSGVWRDSEPRVNSDGTRLYFVSNRPPAPDAKPLLTPRGNPGANIWYVNKSGNGWSEPVHIEGPINAIPTVYNPSVAKNGNIYFSGNLPAGGAKNQIYLSRFNNGQYEAPELLSFSDPKWNNLDPYISPDERFMIFISDRSGSFAIHICFQKDGKWGEPVSLGDGVNSKYGEISPSLAPDGKTLFFTSARRADTVFPKQKETFADMEKRLHDITNGSRNIWQVDISSWINAK